MDEKDKLCPENLPEMEVDSKCHNQDSSKAVLDEENPNSDGDNIVECMEVEKENLGNKTDEKLENVPSASAFEENQEKSPNNEEMSAVLSVEKEKESTKNVDKEGIEAQARNNAQEIDSGDQTTMENESTMESEDTSEKDDDFTLKHNRSANIEEIPDEVLEYIFKIISPYQDLRSCSRVNRRWRRLCFQACKSKLLAFHNQLTEGELLWKTVMNEQSPDNVSRRYSHCAVYSDKHLCMFIFGGCTASSSTFNDLLQFDLSTRSWIRPRAIGSYPSPKALATMVTNDDILILFGGWTHPSIYPLHQTWKLFSELHIFNIAESKWSQVKCDDRDAWPPQTAGHSATLHGDKMVVFGGLTMQRGSENLSFQCSNNLWVFSLSSMTWYLQPTAGQQTPNRRYGQSQIYLDSRHLLILGGWLDRGNSDLTDVWMLEMGEGEEEWRWHEIMVKGAEHRPKDISRHPAARAAKDRVVVLAKSKIASRKPQALKGKPTMIRNAIGAVPSSSSGGARGHHHHGVGARSHQQHGAARHHQHAAASSSSEENEYVEPRRRPVGGGGGGGPGQAGAGASSHHHHGHQHHQPGPSHHHHHHQQPGPSHHHHHQHQEDEHEHHAAAAPHHHHHHHHVHHHAAAAGGHDQGIGHQGGSRLDRELHALGAPKPVKQRMLENRQRQLASLNRMEERLRSSAMQGASGGGGAGRAEDPGRGAGAGTSAGPPQSSPPLPVCPNHRMMMNILDTSRAISEHTVRWLPPNPRLPGVDVPQEVDLYTLVQGRTELVLFGGLKRDITIRGAPPNHSTRDSSSVTNNVHILYPHIQNI